MLNNQPLSPHFGAELDAGIELLHCSDEAIEALKLLVAKEGVLVARNQSMTPAEQAAFAARLGELFPSPKPSETVPEGLIQIKADERSKGAAGTAWHTDVSSEARPPSISMLRMEVVPPIGGDTLFMDMRQVFSNLSAKMQDLLKQLTARHDPVGHYLYLSGQKALHELPSGHHPIVRQIPETGDVALYVNEGFTRGIDGLAESESKFLLRFLFDTIRASVPAQIRVKWQPDTIVFWDNRLVQHHAVFDYFPHRRLGYRATVRGEAPIAA